jgi:tetratricopeptide (TPR) repeat protein
MDAVTYPDEKVIAFVQDFYIPLQIPFDAKPLSSDFNVKWTPTLITLGSDKREHHRTVGFLDPDAFIASSLLGIGKYHFDNDQYAEALTFFEKIISEQSQSDSVAEALFLRGVSLYKNSGDPKPLKEAYETLSSQFPNSEWTKRAYPYRLL